MFTHLFTNPDVMNTELKGSLKQAALRNRLDQADVAFYAIVARYKTSTQLWLASNVGILALFLGSASYVLFVDPTPRWAIPVWLVLLLEIVLWVAISASASAIPAELSSAIKQAHEMALQVSTELEVEEVETSDEEFPDSRV